MRYIVYERIEKTRAYLVEAKDKGDAYNKVFNEYGDDYDLDNDYAVLDVKDSVLDSYHLDTVEADGTESL